MSLKVEVLKLEGKEVPLRRVSVSSLLIKLMQTQSQKMRALAKMPTLVGKEYY